MSKYKVANMDWQWLKKLGKAVSFKTDVDFDTGANIATRQVNNTDRKSISQISGADLWETFQDEAEEQQQNIRLAQMKLQYIQQMPEQGLPKQTTKLNYRQAKALQEFIQSVQQIRSETQQDFNGWRTEQEQKLQRELERYREEFATDWQPISSKLL